jgi:enamine deaminase RidA (YjgF/YER057c/UK114 family)
MSQRLVRVGLTLEAVVKMDILMYDRANIPAMEKVFKGRFHGVYPARKVIATEFAHRGNEESDSPFIQIDAVAYKR